MWPEETVEFLRRQQAVEQNGNTGEHYEVVPSTASDVENPKPTEDLKVRGK